MLSCYVVPPSSFLRETKRNPWDLAKLKNFQEESGKNWTIPTIIVRKRLKFPERRISLEEIYQEFTEFFREAHFKVLPAKVAEQKTYSWLTIPLDKYNLLFLRQKLKMGKHCLLFQKWIEMLRKNFF